jgi:pilus assembly protein Flp/PilA
MRHALQKFQVRLHRLFAEELGQDMVEYALVVALIAFAATAGMKDLAGGVSKAFDNISTNLSSYVA